MFYLLIVKSDRVFHRRGYGFNQLGLHVGASWLLSFTFSYARILLQKG